MPIKVVKTDQEWGNIWYCKTDPHQKERSLVALKMLPESEILFGLQAFDEEEPGFYYPFECTQEPDQVKKLNNQRDDDGNEGDVT